MTPEATGFVLAPNRTWHQHGAQAEGSTRIRHDGPDIRFVNAMEANFHQVHPDLTQAMGCTGGSPFVGVMMKHVNDRPGEDACLFCLSDAPVKRALGLFRDEALGENSGQQPVILSRPPTTVAGPGQTIEDDANITRQLDGEVELAVIIGTSARRLRRKAALADVFASSVMIDVSGRDNRRAGIGSSPRGRTPTRPLVPAS